MRAVSGDAGLSAAQISRIERGILPTVSLDQLARLGAVVGLDVRAHAYPGPDPTLDTGQLALFGRFSTRLSPTLGLRHEVPLPIERDQRAWDGMIDGLKPASGDGAEGMLSLPMDADTRLIDVQAQLRRIRLKLRDSGMDSVLWLIADTNRNRAALAGAGALLASDFPVSSRRALGALRDGRHPGGSAFVVL
jgi:hypothetical protein